MDRSTATLKNIFTRFTLIVVALGLLFGAAALWGANKKILGLFHDDGIYAVAAKAVAQGEGYRILSLPGAPAQTKYPFLYSYLVSALWVLDSSFPQNLWLLKSLNSAILAGIFFLAAICYRRYCRASTVAAILFAVLVCSNPIVFGFTDYLLSDLLLVLCALGALTLSAGDEQSRARFSQLALLGAVVGLACLTRTAALPLVFAGALHSWAVRGWRGALIFLSALILLVAPWFLWVGLPGQLPADSLLAYYSAYDLAGAGSSDWLVLISRHWPIIYGNGRYIWDMLDMIYLLPLLPGFGWFIALFSLLGMFASARGNSIFLWSFLLSSLGLQLIWPFHPGRYLAPLLPLLVLLMFRGMALAQLRLETMAQDNPPRRWLGKLVWCPVVVMLVLNGVWLSAYLLERDEQTVRGLNGNRLAYSWAGFEESFAWLRAHAAPDAVLATAYDPMYYLYTGRRAIRPALHRPATYFYPYGQTKPEVGTVDEIKPQIVKMGIDYLIIDPMAGYAEGKATVKLFESLVQSFGDQAEPVFTSGDGMHRIFRITHR
jgi:4-amino-4-deoxy-L-arabinose transferase-like glycosyltransferase